MAYRQQLYISPTTLTDLTVTIEYDNQEIPSKTATLNDFSIVNDELKTSFALLDDCTVTIQSQGYETETLNITIENLEDKHIVLTPLLDYFSKVSDGTDTYFVKAEVIKDQQNSSSLKYWTGTKAQYDAIVTKDNNTLYNITDDNTADAYQAYTKSEVDALIQDALYYKSGDTFESISYCECPAIVTSSGTSVRIGITTPKRLDNITSVTCNSLMVNLRKSTGGYAPSSDWDAKANATSISCTIGASNMLYIWVNYDNYGFTNNTPVGCEIRSFSFTFT